MADFPEDAAIKLWRRKHGRNGPRVAPSNTLLKLQGSSIKSKVAYTTKNLNAPSRVCKINKINKIIKINKINETLR